jgi:hypothetical protein
VPAASVNRLGDPEFDPRRPAAYPLSRVTDLLGEMPVRLRAEGTSLIAYGFGGQRIQVPAGAIDCVWIHRGYHRREKRATAALLVIDQHRRVLLRAPGTWAQPEVAEICRHLGLRKPKFLSEPAARQEVPRLVAAGRNRVLRTRPRGYALRSPAVTLATSAMFLCGGVAGALLPLALPPSVGDARDLLAIAACPTCALAAGWLARYLGRLGIGGYRWAVLSRRAGSLAPPGQFLRVTGTSEWTTRLLTATLALAVPVLAIWGLTIMGDALAHGFRGSQAGTLVAGVAAVLAVPLLAWLSLHRRRAAREHHLRDELTEGLG